MFADLGHFNIKAIQLSFSFITFPSVVLCYMGQASYLHKFPQDVGETFFKSIPAQCIAAGAGFRARACFRDSFLVDTSGGAHDTGAVVHDQ
ncbi:potassium transporter 20-like [Triticum dicoccoides]|uniref:potassium transporter 20-like n=1 Tax=Triticum dicoccoides TaxID=85692 RepID=UPI000E7AE073|nr:potassium transporter 20-like [Triticum dicoccoides]